MRRVGAVKQAGEPFTQSSQVQTGARESSALQWDDLRSLPQVGCPNPGYEGGGARARDKMTNYLATREEERRGQGVRPAGIYVGRQLGRGDAISGGDLSV